MSLPLKFPERRLLAGCEYRTKTQEKQAFKIIMKILLKCESWKSLQVF